MKIKNIIIHFYKHFFFYILIPLVIIVGAVSYFRFMVNNDYLVGYEGVCDSATDKCFIGCEDDTFTISYFFSKMIKYAPDLYEECGKDITDCEAASICLPGDRQCSVAYCNSEIESNVCSVLSTESNTQNNNEESSLDETLQDNNTNNTNI